MKTFIVVCLILFIGPLSISAQTESTLKDLLERLQESHIGSVSDVFTQEEQQILRAHFANFSTNIEITEGRDLSPGWATRDQPSEIYGNFSIDDPEHISYISTSPVTAFEGAGVRLANENPLKSYAGDSDGNVWLIDEFGSYSNFGSVQSLPTGVVMVGFEYIVEPGDNVMYAQCAEIAGAQAPLYAFLGIDENTDVRIIGDTGLSKPINLAADSKGELFTVDIDDDILYHIDKKNANATAIGPIGFDANFGQGMAYEPNTKMIYMAAFNATTFQSELRSVNTTTGMTTFLGAIGSKTPGGTVQLGWISSNDNDDPTAIDENVFSEFSVYPIPTVGILTIKTKTIIAQIEIFNTLGQLVLSSTYENKIDISSLSQGLYFIKVKDENGNFGTRKVVKK